MGIVPLCGGFVVAENSTVSVSSSYEIFRVVSPDGTAGIIVVSIVDNEIDVVTPGWGLERMEVEAIRMLRVLPGAGT